MTAMALRRRYWTDPLWRAARLAKNRASRQERMKHPVYRRLENVRKKVSSTRQVYERYEKRTHHQFIKLQRLIKQRERLVAAWNNRKSPSKVGGVARGTERAMPILPSCE